ncbi:MAG: flavoprotein [Alphaproteobacteria bacterium]|nr:flavoprotein [Alphaproteobacteria bacterium]
MDNENNRVILVVTGTIASIKTPDLIAKLKEAKKDITVILTRFPEYYEWVNIPKIEAATGHKVLTAASPLSEKEKVLNAAQAILVISSADMAAQIVHEDPGLGKAIADALRKGAATFFAPAMNVKIWAHPAVRKNFFTLHDHNAILLGPVKGPMACGDEGYGRMLDVNTMVEALQASLEGAPHDALSLYQKAYEETAPDPKKQLAPLPKNLKRLLIVLCGDVDTEELDELVTKIKKAPMPIDWVVDSNLPNKNEILACLKDLSVVTDHYQIVNAEGKKDGMEHIRLPEKASLVVYPFLNDKTATAMLEGRGGSLCLDIALASKAPIATTPECVKSGRLSQPVATRLGEIRIALLDLFKLI